ncbi:MAG: hypothetical protein QGF53_05490 [Alphaproteobacteria bacterium]|nr:hypothetical protein [Alphaproteobacteria bacterium]
MTSKTALLALACTAAIAFGAQAEESETPLFDALSVGNQRIAQALFDSQGDGDSALTLENIAQFKADGLGWGAIFKTLRAEGSLPGGARNLGQVVSGRYQPPQDEDTIAFDTDPEPGIEPEPGLADSLSPDNRKIAEALFAAQKDGGLDNFTLDEIAMLKSDGVGWGQVFKHMRIEGAVPEGARNLGQVVSGHYQPPVLDVATAGITTGEGRSSRPVVVTTGAGGRIVLGANGGGVGVGHGGGVPGIGNGNAFGHAKASGVDSLGIISTAGGPGNGNAYGHRNGQGNGHGWGGAKGPKAP